MSNDCPFCKLSSDVHTLDCVFIPNKTQQPVGSSQSFEEWYSKNGYYHDTISDRKELMREAWLQAWSNGYHHKLDMEIALERESSAESGWVIELAASEPCSPQYWAGSSLWVPEHLRALRFARKQDAQQAADFMLDGMKIRICEHTWG